MDANLLERLYKFTRTESKVVERIIDDEHVNINHMVLRKGECLPEHFSNSNVYMVIVRGTVSLQLGEQEVHTYLSGSIINIPYNIKMNVSNQQEDILEFFVVKAPSPKNYKA